MQFSRRTSILLPRDCVELEVNSESGDCYLACGGQLTVQRVWNSRANATHAGDDGTTQEVQQYRSPAAERGNRLLAHSCHHQCLFMVQEVQGKDGIAAPADSSESGHSWVLCVYDEISLTCRLRVPLQGKPSELIYHAVSSALLTCYDGYIEVWKLLTGLLPEVPDERGLLMSDCSSVAYQREYWDRRANVTLSLVRRFNFNFQQILVHKFSRLVIVVNQQKAVYWDVEKEPTNVVLLPKYDILAVGKSAVLYFSQRTKIGILQRRKAISMSDRILDLRVSECSDGRVVVLVAGFGIYVLGPTLLILGRLAGSVPSQQWISGTNVVRQDSNGWERLECQGSVAFQDCFDEKGYILAAIEAVDGDNCRHFVIFVLNGYSISRIFVRDLSSRMPLRTSGYVVAVAALRNGTVYSVSDEGILRGPHVNLPGCSAALAVNNEWQAALVGRCNGDVWIVLNGGYAVLSSPDRESASPTVVTVVGCRYVVSGNSIGHALVWDIESDKCASELLRCTSAGNAFEIGQPIFSLQPIMSHMRHDSALLAFREVTSVGFLTADASGIVTLWKGHALEMCSSRSLLPSFVVNSTKVSCALIVPAGREVGVLFGTASGDIHLGSLSGGGWSYPAHASPVSQFRECSERKDQFVAASLDGTISEWIFLSKCPLRLSHIRVYHIGAPCAAVMQDSRALLCGSVCGIQRIDCARSEHRPTFGAVVELLLSIRSSDGQRRRMFHRQSSLWSDEDDELRFFPDNNEAELDRLCGRLTGPPRLTSDCEVKTLKCADPTASREPVDYGTNGQNMRATGNVEVDNNGSTAIDGRYLRTPCSMQDFPNCFELDDAGSPQKQRNTGTSDPRSLQHTCQRLRTASALSPLDFFRGEAVCSGGLTFEGSRLGRSKSVPSRTRIARSASHWRAPLLVQGQHVHETVSIAPFTFDDPESQWATVLPTFTEAVSWGVGRLSESAETAYMRWQGIEATDVNEVQGRANMRRPPSSVRAVPREFGHQTIFHFDAPAPLADRTWQRSRERSLTAGGRSSHTRMCRNQHAASRSPEAPESVTNCIDSHPMLSSGMGTDVVANEIQMPFCAPSSRKCGSYEDSSYMTRNSTGHPRRIRRADMIKYGTAEPAKLVQYEWTDFAQTQSSWDSLPFTLMKGERVDNEGARALNGEPRVGASARETKQGLSARSQGTGKRSGNCARLRRPSSTPGYPADLEVKAATQWEPLLVKGPRVSGQKVLLPTGNLKLRMRASPCTPLRLLSRQ